MGCSKCGAPDAMEVQGGEYPHLCCNCWNASVRERRGARKAELDAMPRCEVSRCSRRGTWDVGYRPTVKLCGQHKNAAHKKLAERLAPVASIAMFSPTRVSGRELLAMLEG